MTGIQVEHKGDETKIILSGHHEVILFMPETSKNRSCIIVERKEVKEDVY